MINPNKKKPMKRYYLLFVLVLVFVFTYCTKDKPVSLETPLEKSAYKELTTNKELMAFIQKADSVSNDINVEILHETEAGKKIALVKVAQNGEFSDDKLKVFLFAQQHGNEPSGKEALLLFIESIVEGKADSLLSRLDLLIIPQVNPDGGDIDQRRNANDIDPNRDHLLMQSDEVQAVHKVFNQYIPEVTVDIHEYYPYRKSWFDFGYLKQFDMQLGAVTNPNIDRSIYHLEKQIAIPFVEKYVEQSGYSFFEYTLGAFSLGERLRHSTVDINDGRQSLGIQNSMSFILEGLNGKDSIQNIERRAKVQQTTINGLLSFCYENHQAIKETVKESRQALLNPRSGDSVAVRADHVKGAQPLHYILKSIATGKDTTFIVEEYHSEVISLLDVTKPKAYLIPADDKLLIGLLNKHEINYEMYSPDENDALFAYSINEVTEEEIEGLNLTRLHVEKRETNIDKDKRYVKVPLNQLKSNMIVLAFEPESSLGLITYSKFDYLYKDKEIYPVLRIE